MVVQNVQKLETSDLGPALNPLMTSRESSALLNLSFPMCKIKIKKKIFPEYLPGLLCEKVKLVCKNSSKF